MIRNGHTALRALALAASALAAACSHDDGKSAGAAPPPLPVTVVAVRTQNVPVSLESVGQAEGSRDVEIRARVTGILEKREYEEGTAVQAGQLMFTIDPAPFELAVEDARAALQQARVARELAGVDVKRLTPLAADKAISQRDLD